MSDALWLVFGLLAGAVVLVGLVFMVRVWKGDVD
jgi:hypothetical protein